MYSNHRQSFPRTAIRALVHEGIHYYGECPYITRIKYKPPHTFLVYVDTCLQRGRTREHFGKWNAFSHIGFSKWRTDVLFSELSCVVCFLSIMPGGYPRDTCQVFLGKKSDPAQLLPAWALVLVMPTALVVTLHITFWSLCS
jgi:hypothetical protein